MTDKLAAAINSNIDASAHNIEKDAGIGLPFAIGGASYLGGAALDLGGKALETGAKIIGEAGAFAAPLAVIAPALAAATVALAHSKVTSPTLANSEALRNEMYTAELERTVRRIKKVNDRQKRRAGNAKNTERSLHI